MTRMKEGIRAICEDCAGQLNLTSIIGLYPCYEPCGDCGKLKPTTFTDLLKPMKPKPKKCSHLWIVSGWKKPEMRVTDHIVRLENGYTASQLLCQKCLLTKEL